MAPFGTAFAALLLSIHAGNGRWLFWRSWDDLADMVGLGAVMYGMTVLTLEGGLTVMFWALDERDKRRERRNKELQQQVLEDIIAKLRQNPDSNPVAVVEQMRDEARNGQGGRR